MDRWQLSIAHVSAVFQGVLQPPGVHADGSGVQHVRCSVPWFTVLADLGQCLLVLALMLPLLAVECTQPHSSVPKGELLLFCCQWGCTASFTTSYWLALWAGCAQFWVYV